MGHKLVVQHNGHPSMIVANWLTVNNVTCRRNQLLGKSIFKSMTIQHNLVDALEKPDNAPIGPRLSNRTGSHDSANTRLALVSDVTDDRTHMVVHALHHIRVGALRVDKAYGVVNPNMCDPLPHAGANRDESSVSGPLVSGDPAPILNHMCDPFTKGLSSAIVDWPNEKPKAFVVFINLGNGLKPHLPMC
eukprot:GDKK01029373.1.p2 GENE.GDKK01029373.1~~GDKK01029373.1.p2  ORF type:complete len:190 (+),score=8.84 GDKK01029373.1:81-650(+)